MVHSCLDMKPSPVEHFRNRNCFKVKIKLTGVHIQFCFRVLSVRTSTDFKINSDSLANTLTASHL